MTHETIVYNDCVIAVRDTIDKRKFIRGAYKALGELTSRKYFDTDWRGVKGAVARVIDSCKNVTLYLENAKYEGVLGCEGHRKVFEYTIMGCSKPTRMVITAFFCGTMADPMSAYDLAIDIV